MVTDIESVTVVKDKDGTLLTWLGNFDDLLNVENERNGIPVQGPLEEIYLKEVVAQLGKMKRNKACGPDCLPIKAAKSPGDD